MDSFYDLFMNFLKCQSGSCVTVNGGRESFFGKPFNAPHFCSLTKLQYMLMGQQSSWHLGKPIV